VNVAVFGAAGMLGAATVREWRDHGHNVAALTRADLDVTVPDDIARVIAHHAPDVLINCTAYNQVDAAEADPSTALAVNAWAVRSLAQTAARVGAVFVHYSTDFVFDGTTNRPYVEDDNPNPQSAYGMSKLVGEWMAAEAPEHYVLRVESLFGGAASRSTIDRMLENLTAGRLVTAFSDRTVSPSHVGDVARATRELVMRRAPFGLYHCVNAGMATWLEIAERLREWSENVSVEIHPTRALDVSLPARRPQFCALSNAKLIEAGISMPTWQDALRRHVARAGLERAAGT
jgi:dTDP-4-dehydrorhamnose reductase